MGEAGKSGVPGWYWVVAIIGLLWEAIGCFAYVSQVGMSPEAFAALPQAQQDIWNMTPPWVTAAYAVAVWSGLAAGVALLLRKAWARPLYALSLAALVVQFGWTFAATPIMTSIGPSAIGLPAFIFVVGAVYLWFAGHARQRSWIG